MLGFTRQFIGMPFAFINIERLCATHSTIKGQSGDLK
jgi:hypothetical protein